MAFTYSYVPTVSGNLTYTPRYHNYNTTFLPSNSFITNGLTNDQIIFSGDQTISGTMTFEQAKPSCMIQFGKETFNLKEMREKQEKLESENKALKLRLQKLETWFDHIRERSSVMDEFIKTADEVIKQSEAQKLPQTK